ncbi:MAG TPA: hypothetical protein PKD64_02285 [Pirellulaceae bacterium]|nr:hypothetical protein [Pirellulaceae bacterium]HMO90997.1 hypothetical protein [Pirellulaceae bacterium]HMP68112.1 hypothetical protein [Pirellulaceae bacterium]
MTDLVSASADGQRLRGHACSVIVRHTDGIVVAAAVSAKQTARCIVGHDIASGDGAEPAIGFGAVIALQYARSPIMNHRAGIPVLIRPQR